MATREMFAEMDDAALMDAAKTVLEVTKERGLAVPGAIGSLATETTVSEASGIESLASVTREQVTEQLSTASMVYTRVAMRINGERTSKDRFKLAGQETLAAELAGWLTDEKVEYLASAMEADPELDFTLVATPNVVATHAEIDALMEVFSDVNQSARRPFMVRNFIDGYSSEQLSGTEPGNGNSVIFSLIPNKVSSEIYGTAEELKGTIFPALKEKYPFLKVTSILEDLTYWRALCADGRTIKGQKAYDLTNSRKFNMATLDKGWGISVLKPCVDEDGVPVIGTAIATERLYTRISVG